MLEEGDDRLCLLPLEAAAVLQEEGCRRQEVHPDPLSPRRRAPPDPCRRHMGTKFRRPAPSPRYLGPTASSRCLNFVRDGDLGLNLVIDLAFGGVRAVLEVEEDLRNNDTWDRHKLLQYGYLVLSMRQKLDKF